MSDDELRGCQGCAWWTMVALAFWCVLILAMCSATSESGHEEPASGPGG